MSILGKSTQNSSFWCDWDLHFKRVFTVHISGTCTKSEGFFTLFLLPKKTVLDFPSHKLCNIFTILDKERSFHDVLPEPPKSAEEVAIKWNLSDSGRLHLDIMGQIHHWCNLTGKWNNSRDECNFEWSEIGLWGPCCVAYLRHKNRSKSNCWFYFLLYEAYGVHSE